MRLPTDPFTNSPLTFPLTFMLTHGLNGSEYSTLLLLLAACDPLVARDSRLISSANTGRPILQGAAMSFDGATQGVTAAHLVGTETVVSSHGTSTPTVSAGSIAFTAGTCALLELSDGTLYEMQERGGSIAYDSSGAGNNGVYVGSPVSVTDNTIPVDPANERGFSEYLQQGTLPFDSALSTLSFKINTTDTQYFLGVNDRGSNASFFGIAVQQGSASLAYQSNYVTSYTVDGVDKTTATRGDLYTLISDGESHQIDIVYNSVATWASFVIGGDVVGGFKLTEGAMWDFVMDGVPTEPLTIDASSVYLARSDDPTTDVAGNPTQWQGSAYPVRPVERQSNALSFDGATQSMTVAALTGSETVVSSEGTSTPTISAGTIDFTAGTCSNLVLSNGFVFNMAEGAGSTAYNKEGTNHATLIGNPTWVREDGIPSSNLDDGFSLYEHASLDPIRVPYRDNGQPLTITPPAGYTKTSDNPASKDGHNGAETELDFYNIATDGGTTPAIVASGVVLTDYSFGQMLLNPMFKRTISSVLEDRHTLFAAVLTGDCLETANEYTQ